MLIKYFILLTTIFLTEAHAIKNRVGFDVGTGMKSNQGSLALGLRYFPIERLDVHYHRAIEVVGSISSLGARYYTPVMSETCFFVVACESRYYLGAKFGQSDGGIYNITDDGIETNYNIDQSNFVDLSIGFFDIFKQKFTYSADISYRSFVQEPGSKLRDGEESAAAREVIETYFESGLGIGLNVGYLF